MSVDLDSLAAALRASWQSDTSDCPDLWTTANPARGQCAVTAKVVQDHFGGTVVLAAVNVLPSGEHVDLTADQFDFDHELGEPVEQEPIVDHTGVNRHLLLADRVADHLDRS
ncbi:MAG: hypothetical protein ACE367_26410 [Acidimicrobiales bacterium]